ncbi:MAG: hypothetical protein V1844_23405 [Pseudomonadota bacterium]
MTEASSLPDSSLLFFRSLFMKTGGDKKKQVSMYAKRSSGGNEAGLDKSASKIVAEELMSLGLIAKRSSGRTLAGGIGLTEEGVLEAQDWFADIPGINAAGMTIGNHPVIGGKISTVSTDILTNLKPRVGKIGMTFDDLTELLADIQSRTKSFLAD